jgi:hypothetical protein
LLITFLLVLVLERGVVATIRNDVTTPTTSDLLRRVGVGGTLPSSLSGVVVSATKGETDRLGLVDAIGSSLVSGNEQELLGQEDADVGAWCRSERRRERRGDFFGNGVFGLPTVFLLSSVK